MPQTRPCDVTPESPQDRYSLALQNRAGQWIGLDVPLQNIRPGQQTQNTPIQRVGINSFHMGRGFERFTPEQYGFFDSLNFWRTTPGKGHAGPLFRFADGLRNADYNMPAANGVTWKRLTGTTKYLDVSFTAGGGHTAAKLILLIRKRVPAGTTGAPGTLTVEICTNNGGNPDTVLETATLTAADVADVTSEYYTWTISEALTASTVYHVKVYGATGDRDEACWEVACDPTAAGLRSSAGSSWTATTFSPYYRLTPADLGRQFKFFEFLGCLYAVSIYNDATTNSELYLNGVRGRAVGAQTSTTLRDTGRGTYGATDWTTDRFAGCTIRIIRGTGAGQERTITANNANTFTVSPAWDTTPVADSSQYVVYGSSWWVQIGSTGLGMVTGPPTMSGGTVYFPQGDSTNIRIMQLDYTDADDHAFDVENTNNNKATFLVKEFDSALGPLLWRANNDTASGTPSGRKVSVAKAPTAPSGTPVAFGTDVTFQTSIPIGSNTYQINNLFTFNNKLYVGKENSLYIVDNDKATRVSVGLETASSATHFIASVIGSDRNLYVGYMNDMYLVAGGGSYPTNLMNAMPSDRSGYVSSLEARKSWIFAAVDAGTGTSSVMMYAIKEQSWSELWRGFFAGRRIRNIAWQENPGGRPRLWVDISGEMVYLEFPLNGVRPYDDDDFKYQHEFAVTLPTIDLANTDSKYFARLTVTTQGLATEDDTETGHELIVEWQADNDVGSTNWTHAGYIRQSPTGYVDIDRGNQRMIRIRLRGVSSEVDDPVIIEALSLSLFSRGQIGDQWAVFFQLAGDDEEQNSYKTLRWLIEQAETPQPLLMYSRFPLYHNRTVTLANKPNYVLEELNPEDEEIEANLQMYLVEVT